MKKLLSVVLSFLLVISSFGVVSFATDENVAAETDGNNTVSESEIIEIRTWDDLKALDTRVEGGDMLEGVTVKLMNDIDLYEMGTDGEPVTFNPIGANQSYFKGTFDGQNHTIKNMYQSGWALGYDWDNYGTIGLFAYLWNATIKNLTIENAECFVEGGNVAAIAGCAWGDCTFENITVKNSTFATYNNRAGGIVGYTGGSGTFIFKGITVDEDTVIAGLWGSFDSSLGGVMGQLQSASQAVFEDVDVKCRLDAYNDVTAAYKYYAYRMCGMLIGRIEVDDNNQPILDNVTIGDNVSVTFDGWANYSYINTSGSTWQRVEAGYAYGGVDVTQYPDAEIITKDFQILFGGQQYGSYGQIEHEDVEVIILPAAAYAMIGNKGYWSLEKAVADSKLGDTIILTKDYDGEAITLPDGVGLDKNGFDAPNMQEVVIDSGLNGSGTQTDPYQIGSVEDLVKFRNSVNAGETKYNAEGVYVVLTADIDLASVANWAPIGTFDYSFDGNFNGQGHKIINLKMSDNTAANGEAYLGFFGITANNTIENFVIENVTINSNGQIVAAAIAYPYYTTVKDITVCGNIAIKGGNYTAGVLAYTRLCQNASNLTVSGNADSYITGATVVGGVIADIQMNKGLVADYSNFNVADVTITGNKCVGGISGIIAKQTINGATVENVVLNCADSRVGVVAGSLGGASTISNVTVSNVTGAATIVGGAYDGGAAVEAKIGNTYYATWEAAVAAANGSEVTLLEPIVIQANENVTLEDVKIVYVSDVIDESMINNKGALTIVNSTISYIYTGEGDTAFTKGNYTIRNEGTLVVESGNIENKSAQATHCNQAIFQYSGSTTINGGTISTPAYRSVRLWKGNMTINGGTFIGQVWVQAVDNSSKMTINGGNFTPVANDASSVFVTNSTYDVEFAVTGGTFNGKIGCSNATKLAGAISGGLFTENAKNGTNTALLGDNFVFEANENGYYGIVAKPTGTNSPAYTKEVGGFVRVWGEGGGNAKESFVLKLYSDDTLMATTSLNNIGGIIDGDVYVTWNFYYPESNDEYWTTVWEEGHPNSSAQPTKVELWIDGTCVVTTVVKMSGADDINPVVWKDLGGVKYIVTGLEGSGTEADPFLINNKEELLWFQAKVDEQAADGSTQFAGVHFKLTADIDLAGINWNPIGSMSGDHGSFKGVFDGDGHTISNLYVKQAGTGLGLFARTAGNAVIKNLNIVNASIISTNNSNYLGVVVANAYANTKIENVHVSGDILVSGRGYIGGIAGHGYVVMDNVSVIANEGSLITSTFWCAGGILGYGGEGATNIKNAHVEGITITSAAGGLGAIVGMAEDNNGTQPISGSNLSAKDVEIKTYVGGYGTDYEDYAMGYLYGGNPTSILTGTLTVENVNVTTASGNPASVNDAVASANGVIYFDLQSAINAGGNIVILRDIEISKTINISESMTIDGNGHTLTQAKSFVANGANVLFDIFGNATATFKNIKFDGIKNVGIIRTVNANLVMDNCTVENCDQTVAQGLLRLACGNATITNSNFLNNTCSMVVTFGYDAANDTDVLLIDNCTFQGNTCGDTAVVYFADGDYGKVTNSKFLNNSVSATGNAATLYMGWGSGFEVNGCTFDGNTVTTTHATTKRFASAIFADGCAIKNNVFGTNTAIRNGETISTTVAVGAYYGEASVSDNYWGGDAPVPGVDYTIEYTRNDVTIESYFADAELTNKVILKNVAKVGKYSYTTLADAFAAAQDGDTILVLSDFTLDTMIVNNKKITLDLNGKTITGTDTTSKNFSLIDNRGELTITGNGTITLTATVNSGWNRYSAVIANNPGGKLVVENGTIEHLGGTDMAYGIDNLTNGKGTYAETVINGGTIKSTYSGIRQFLNGVEAQNILTVNGGTVMSDNRAIFFQDPSKNANSGTLTITDNAKIYGKVHLSVTEGSTEWPVEVSVAAAALQGESAVTNNYLPAGYVIENNGGVYGVAQKTAIATVNGVEYYDLQEAINAAANGGTVELIANVELTNNITVAKDANVTINLNGFDITYTAVSESGNNMITNNGKLTFNGDGNVTYTENGTAPDNNSLYACNLIRNTGTLIINGGTFTVETPVAGKFNVTALVVDNYASSADSYVEINGGTFVSEYFRTIRLFATSTTYKNQVVINGGDFEGQVWLQSTNANQNIAILEINGGTFAPTANDASAVYITTVSSTAIDVAITDGTFNGKIGIDNTTNLSGFVTGGTFTATAKAGTNEAVLAESFEFVENSNGTFGVEEVKEEKLNTRLYYVKGFKPAGSNETRYGFLMTIGIDSLNYKNDGCGFYLTIDGVTRRFIIEGGIVWEDLTVVYPDRTDYITPDQFGAGNKYIMNYTVYFTDAQLAALGDKEVTVQGFVTTFDGVEIKTNVFNCGKLAG